MQLLLPQTERRIEVEVRFHMHSETETLLLKSLIWTFVCRILTGQIACALYLVVGLTRVWFLIFSAS